MSRKKVTSLKDYLGEGSGDQKIDEQQGDPSIGIIENEAKLNSATDVVVEFINKKAGKQYRKYPFLHFVSGQPGIMLYTDSDNTAIRVGLRNNGPGIIGDISFFSDWLVETADIYVTSEQFNITALLPEFIRLITDEGYAKKVAESRVNEGQVSKLSEQDEAEVKNRLKKGDSAADVSRDLGLAYSQILKVRKSADMSEDANPMEEKNEQQLQDDVKYLNEVLQDTYDISRKVAAGAFNSLMITGRAGTGKSHNVEQALEDEGLEEDTDYVIVSGSVSTILMYQKMYEYKTKLLVFDDADDVFRDEAGRNILKSALDTKAERKITYFKQNKNLYDPSDYENDPEGEENALQNGLTPNNFIFKGRIIFISNLDKDKADPDGAIKSRSILIDVNPDDATLMERLRSLLPHLEPSDMPIEEKEDVYEFMKEANDVSMRTFVKAAGFKRAGLENWQRMAMRYL